MTNLNYQGNTATGNDEWLTPPHIIEALGEFDLDPCSPVHRPWSTARHHYTKLDNGLYQPWFGAVYCNPPYSQKEMRGFVDRCIEHKEAIMLLFARTDTKLWQERIFPNAKAIMFLGDRLKFWRVDGTEALYSGSPSALIAFSEAMVARITNSKIKGTLIKVINQTK